VRYVAQASASPLRNTRRAWGFSAVGIPEKKRSTLTVQKAVGEFYIYIYKTDRQTHSMVKSGETTAPYCAALAPPESVPFVLGEIVSVQMPHQQRILSDSVTIASIFPVTSIPKKKKVTYSPK
jgi:hypothetical protein